MKPTIVPAELANTDPTRDSWLQRLGRRLFLGKLTADFDLHATIEVHALNRNSPDGRRRNFAAHYDLGNDLFAHCATTLQTWRANFFARLPVPA